MAQVINNADATKKKMYAANIGGFGEYHINIKDAIRLDNIPMISATNLKG